MDGFLGNVNASEMHDVSLPELKRVYSNISVLEEEEERSFTTVNRQYTIKALIGEGSFGQVYDCTVTRSMYEAEMGQRFAAKIINVKRIGLLTGHHHDLLMSKLLKEAVVLRVVAGHPNIIGLHSVCISMQSLRVFFVLELVQSGDLFSYVVQRRKPFAEAEVRTVSRQLVSAVAHCHERGVAHRDVKLENIFLSSTDPLTIKLGDFGSATLLQDKDSGRDACLLGTSKTVTTTEHYRPPEVVEAANANVPYNAYKVDAFNIGIVAYVLVCNSFPDATKGNGYQAHPHFRALSDDGKDFIINLLCLSPQDRLDVEDAQQHVFLIGDSGRRPSSMVSSPICLDSELQGLLAVQDFIKNLQMQRGASCWVLANQEEGKMTYKWRCEAMTRLVEVTQCHLADLCGECWEKLRAVTASITEETKILLRSVDSTISQSGPIDTSSMEHVYSSFCRMLQELVDALSDAISEVLLPLHHRSGPSCTELGLKFHLLVAEQLGRERGFVSGHISRLQEWPVRLRFAKIQGARQMLVGSTTIQKESDVVSSSGSLLPSLFPKKSAPLNEQEIQDLEEAEAHVLEGKKEGSEWWSLITNLINTTHSRFSLGLIEAVHMTVAVGNQKWTESLSPMSSETGSRPPKEATPPSHSCSSCDTPGAQAVAKSDRSQTLPAQITDNNTGVSFLVDEPEDDDGIHISPPNPVPDAKVIRKPGPKPSGMSEDSRKDDPGLLPLEWQTSAFERQTSEFKGESDPVEEHDFERTTTLIPSYTPWSNYNISPQRTPAHWVPGQVPPDPYSNVLTMAHLFNLQEHHLSMPSEAHMNGGQGLGYPYYPPPPGMLRHETGNARHGNRGQSLASEAADPHVMMSVGSVGHPYTCSKLGCKFAARRGCKEGAACSRCHLCVWTRAAERKTRPT